MAVPKKQETPSTRQLIFGINGSGRTFHALHSVAAHKNVLYVGFAKNGLLDIEVPKISNLTSVIVNTWTEFDKQVLVPARKGELTVSAIVIDDYDTAIEYLTPVGSTPTQPEWGILTGKIVTAITMLASHTDKSPNGRLTVITTVADNEETGKRDFVFNPAAIKRLIPKFNMRHYTYATKGKGDTVVDYAVQHNAVLALNFVTNK